MALLTHGWSHAVWPTSPRLLCSSSQRCTRKHQAAADKCRTSFRDHFYIWCRIWRPNLPRCKIKQQHYHLSGVVEAPRSYPSSCPLPHMLKYSWLRLAELLLLVRQAGSCTDWLHDRVSEWIQCKKNKQKTIKIMQPQTFFCVFS